MAKNLKTLILYKSLSANAVLYLKDKAKYTGRLSNFSPGAGFDSLSATFRRKDWKTERASVQQRHREWGVFGGVYLGSGLN